MKLEPGKLYQLAQEFCNEGTVRAYRLGKGQAGLFRNIPVGEIVLLVSLTVEAHPSSEFVEILYEDNKYWCHSFCLLDLDAPLFP